MTRCLPPWQAPLLQVSVPTFFFAMHRPVSYFFKYTRDARCASALTPKVVIPKVQTHENVFGKG